MQHLPLNDGQVEKSSFHGRCHFGTSVGRTGTLESRSFVAVVVSCAVSEKRECPNIFFCSGEGKGDSGATGRGGGGRYFIGNPRRRGVSEEGGGGREGAGRVSAGNLGGRLHIFFGAESDTKKEHKPKLLSPVFFRWGGALTREGVEGKKFGMPLETKQIKLFWRDIPGFCSEIPAVPENFEKKKVSVQFLVPREGPNQGRL